MAQDNRKKLSAKALSLDIRSGAPDSDLKEKYGLSDSQLQSVFKKLIDLGGITAEDLQNRGVKSDAAEEESEFQTTPAPTEARTQAKPQQTLQGVKKILAQAYEQIPPGSDGAQQEPSRKTDETSDQIVDKLLAEVEEAWDWLPDGKRKSYKYFIKPILFVFAFLVLFIWGLIKPNYWWNERWRIYTLLAVFFPLAIYGAWKSDVMSRKEKAAIFGCVIVGWITGSLFK